MHHPFFAFVSFFSLLLVMKSLAAAAAAIKLTAFKYLQVRKKATRIKAKENIEAKNMFSFSFP